MSTLMELEERPMCLPARNSEPHFPKIKTAFSSPRIRKDTDISRHFSSTEINSNKSLCQHISKSNNSVCGSSNNDFNKDYMKSYNTDKGSYSSPSVFEHSSLLRLPNIEHSKKSSIICMPNEIYEQGEIPSLVSSSTDQSQLDQSPRCLSKIDSCNQEETLIHHKDQQFSHNSRRKSFANVSSSHQKDNVLVRFPNIFDHRNGHNSNNLTKRSKEASSFSVRIKPTISSLYRRDISVMGRKSKLSPRTESGDLPRSGPQASALLLPISTTQDYNNREKGKRNRKNKRT